MIKDPKDIAAMQAGTTADAVDDASELAGLRSLIDDLEREKVSLTKGLLNRQHIGFVTGVLGQRYGLQPDAAWRLLARVSQELNVKVVQVADTFLAVYSGTLASQDVKLAARISDFLPPEPRVSPYSTSGVADDHQV